MYQKKCSIFLFCICSNVFSMLPNQMLPNPILPNQMSQNPILPSPLYNEDVHINMEKAPSCPSFEDSFKYRANHRQSDNIVDIKYANASTQNKHMYNYRYGYNPCADRAPLKCPPCDGSFKYGAHQNDVFAELGYYDKSIQNDQFDCNGSEYKSDEAPPCPTDYSVEYGQIDTQNIGLLYNGRNQLHHCQYNGESASRKIGIQIPCPYDASCFNAKLSRKDRDQLNKYPFFK